MSREEQVSRKLSWILRHGAEKEGLRLAEGGYVNLGKVVSFTLLPHRSFTRLANVVVFLFPSLLISSSCLRECLPRGFPKFPPPFLDGFVDCCVTE